MILTNEELYKKKYDYETLKTNIYVVSLLDILKLFNFELAINGTLDSL